MTAVADFIDGDNTRFHNAISATLDEAFPEPALEINIPFSSCIRKRPATAFHQNIGTAELR